MNHRTLTMTNLLNLTHTTSRHPKPFPQEVFGRRGFGMTAIGATSPPARVLVTD
jgi:hypothetical protein